MKDPNDPSHVEDVLQSVARELRTIRRRQGLSQAEAARRSGLAVETISKLENGREWPSLTTLVRLTAALEVSLGAILPGQALQPPEEVPQPRREIRQLMEILPRLDSRSVRQLLALARLLDSRPKKQSETKGP